MTAENLRWLENVFRRTVGENGEIRLQDFKNIVHSKNVSKTDSDDINIIKQVFLIELIVIMHIDKSTHFSLSSHFSWSVSFTSLIKMTMVALAYRSSSMPCTSLLVNHRMIKLNFFSKSMTSTVSYIISIILTWVIELLTNYCERWILAIVSKK